MSPGLFPSTRRSAVLSVGSDDPVERARSFDVLVRAYFKPVYKYIRVRWRKPPEEARDLTQGLFARAFERRYFADFDPTQARFRTYLKTCLDRFVIAEGRAEGRLKRGGDTIRVSLDFDVAEDELERLGSHPEDVDAYFEREWMRALFGASVDALRQRCEAEDKALYFTVFERYVLSKDDPKPTYAELAASLGLATHDVTNYLAWGRRAFRQSVLDRLRELTANEEEFRAEARLVLGVEA